MRKNPSAGAKRNHRGGLNSPENLRKARGGAAQLRVIASTFAPVPPEDAEDLPFGPKLERREVWDPLLDALAASDYGTQFRLDTPRIPKSLLKHAAKREMELEFARKDGQIYVREVDILAKEGKERAKS